MGTVTKQAEVGPSQETTRRDFLKWAWAAAGGLLMLEAGGIALKFVSPRVAEGQFGGVFTVGRPEEFPAGSVTPFNAGRFYLVRAEDGGFLALYRRCTHLGCAVPWDQAAGQFVCPCHASAFEADGDVVNAPAPRPLDRFSLTIEGGLIKVDTSHPIERDHASAEDLVYAQDALS